LPDGAKQAYPNGLKALHHPSFRPYAFPLRAKTHYGGASLSYENSINPSISKTWRAAQALEGGLTRVHFDAGEAPALRFLRRDADRARPRRRLYVPKRGRSSRRDHRRVFRPALLEVAVDVIRPFVGLRFPTRSRPHANEAYATSPSGGGAAQPDEPQSIRAGKLFHGPTLAFQDVAMQ